MFGLNLFTSGGDPRAYRQEIGGAWGGNKTPNDGLDAGLVAGTRVATAMGWRPVEAIAEGDQVLTFDSGLQRVAGVIRGTLWRDPSSCPAGLWPLCVPAEALGNEDPMIILPELAVMIESDAADEVHDDPFALLLARTLDGFRGISRARPTEAIEVVQLVFDTDQVIFAARGALVFCPRLRMLSMDELASDPSPATPYRPLSGTEAHSLINEMRGEPAWPGQTGPAWAA